MKFIFSVKITSITGGAVLHERIDLSDKKLMIENLFIQFGATYGASQVKLSSGLCWTFNGIYFWLDTINFPEKPFFVIEYAETLSDANRNIFVDVDPFPYDLVDDEMLLEVKSFLYGLLWCICVYWVWK